MTNINPSFKLNGQAFVALNGGPQFKFNESISFVINCATAQDVDYYWSKLTEGGQPGQCGWLRDMYGIDKQAEEAANFYCSVFKESQITAVTRAASDNPSNKKGEVMTVTIPPGRSGRWRRC